MFCFCCKVVMGQSTKKDDFGFGLYKIQIHSMKASSNSKQKSQQRQTTDEDSSSCSSEKDEEMLYRRTNPAKHKTQLCKTFSQLGFCPYDFRCRFAHGKHELVRVSTNFGCKNKKCNGFWKNGFCPYGVRCQFGHSEMSWQDEAILMGLAAAYGLKDSSNSKLMNLLRT